MRNWRNTLVRRRELPKSDWPIKSILKGIMYVSVGIWWLIIMLDQSFISDYFTDSSQIQQMTKGFRWWLNKALSSIGRLNPFSAIDGQTIAVDIDRIKKQLNDSSLIAESEPRLLLENTKIGTNSYKSVLSLALQLIAADPEDNLGYYHLDKLIKEFDYKAKLKALVGEEYKDELSKMNEDEYNARMNSILTELLLGYSDPTIFKEKNSLVSKQKIIYAAIFSLLNQNPTLQENYRLISLLPTYEDWDTYKKVLEKIDFHQRIYILTLMQKADKQDKEHELSRVKQKTLSLDEASYTQKHKVRIIWILGEDISVESDTLNYCIESLELFPEEPRIRTAFVSSTEFMLDWRVPINNILSAKNNMKHLDEIISKDSEKYAWLAELKELLERLINRAETIRSVKKTQYIPPNKKK